jgi:hypothetical protein
VNPVARAAAADAAFGAKKPTVKLPVAVGVSAPLWTLPSSGLIPDVGSDPGERNAHPLVESEPTRDVFGLLAGDEAMNTAHTADGALQTSAVTASTTPAPLFTFEGPSNQDNFNVHGFRVNPPDPVGDVGKDQYVAMVNLVFSIYSKTGTLLGGPFALGSLWEDFPIEDCSDDSGDPIVTYDEISNRWILTQFTTRFATNQFYICIAVSHTPNALGSYNLFAFSTGDRFPDYPKYGIWRDSYVVTTREFDSADNESIGIYALKRTDLHNRNKTPKMVEFHLFGPPNLVGDGLLPADVDGKKQPHPSTPIPIVGSQDDGGPDGATFDALNIFHLNVKWSKPEDSTFGLTKQIPIAPYDTIYPCSAPGPPMSGITTRDCLEQPPPANNVNDKLDILSYRQRPMHRLQYRNFGTHETLVTNQSVEAMPMQAGIRWWELRNAADPVLFQEGTWVLPDTVHRWMGSAAMDRDGNMVLGYSVTNATTVFPGIRYAGRAPSDPPGTLSNEQVMQAGSGVQRTTNSRWGDYTSMNVDPRDDCTFYYINEYYTAASSASSTAGWLTRIGAFKFPDCKPGN